MEKWFRHFYHLENEQPSVLRTEKWARTKGIFCGENATTKTTTDGQKYHESPQNFDEECA